VERGVEGELLGVGVRGERGGVRRGAHGEGDEEAGGAERVGVGDERGEEEGA
jgi:hypothetical protein